MEDEELAPVNLDENMDVESRHACSDMPLSEILSGLNLVRQTAALDNKPGGHPSASASSRASRRPAGKKKRKRRAPAADKRKEKEKANDALRLRKVVERNKNDKRGEGRRRRGWSKAEEVEWPEMYEGDKEDKFYCKVSYMFLARVYFNNAYLVN